MGWSFFRCAGVWHGAIATCFGWTVSTIGLIAWQPSFAASPAAATISKIELVQSVQDSSNSVPMVGNKSTIARVYVDYSGQPDEISGQLTILDSSGRPLATLPSGGALSVGINSTANPFSTFTRTLNFRLLDKLTIPGNFTAKVDAIRSLRTGSPINCQNCQGFAKNISFVEVPTFRLRIVLLSYWYDGQIVSPDKSDWMFLTSWITRAYPVGTSQVSTSDYQLPHDFNFDCNTANAALAALRGNDIKAGLDPRTHYLGLVSSKYAFMQGCASGVPSTKPEPWTVASAPAGLSSGRNRPENADDLDGHREAKTFADWYGGHELAHTFGRAHPGWCFTNEAGDNSAPKYPHGRIGNNSDTYAYDAGDDSASMKNAGYTISAQFMAGSQATELMSYCFQPNWPSVYTYKAILARLVDENQNGAGSNQPAANQVAGAGNVSQQPAMGAGPVLLVADPSEAGEFESIVATINVTKQTGRIVAAIQTQAAPAPSSEHPSGLTADIVFRDANNAELGRFVTPVKLDTDVKPENDQLGLIQAIVPRVAQATAIEVELGGKAIDRREIQVTSPQVTSTPIQSNGPPGSNGDYTLSWSAEHSASAKLSYTLQGSRDGKSWSTLAVGLSDPHYKLLPKQKILRWFRVIANDGFNDSMPTLILTPRK